MVDEPVSHAVRLLAPADHAGLADLMIEMQGHYGVPCPAKAAILAGLAALPPGVEIMIAERAGAIIGFASACPLYPGPGLHPGFSSRRSMSRRPAVAPASGAG